MHIFKKSNNERKKGSSHNAPKYTLFDTNIIKLTFSVHPSVWYGVEPIRMAIGPKYTMKFVHCSWITCKFASILT